MLLFVAPNILSVSAFPQPQCYDPGQDLCANATKMKRLLRNRNSSNNNNSFDREDIRLTQRAVLHYHF